MSARHGSCLASSSRSRETLPLPDPIVNEALSVASVRGFANWARFPFGEVEENDTEVVVYLLDARYASRRSSGFGTARVTLPARP